MWSWLTECFQLQIQLEPQQRNQHDKDQSSFAGGLVQPIVVAVVVAECNQRIASPFVLDTECKEHQYHRSLGTDMA